MKPIIGIVPLIDESRDSYWMLPGYMQGIEKAGGVPVMLPLTEDEASLCRLTEMCSGILLSGGHDVSPALYGEEKLPVCTECCKARDAMESRLLCLALEQNKPVLGICRGLQFLNVHLGGSLWQDLPSQRPTKTCHRQQPPYDQPCHEAILPEGSPLRTLLGKESIGVNSCHHQAVKQLAPGLCTMATAPDGTVEAVFMPGRRFVWAVQWHPEFSHKVNPDSNAIFRAFVSACTH